MASPRSTATRILSSRPHAGDGTAAGRRQGMERAAPVDALSVPTRNLLRTRCARSRGTHGRTAPIASETRSEEHTSELQSLMRISYAVFCLKKKTNNTLHTNIYITQRKQRETHTTPYHYFHH